MSRPRPLCIYHSPCADGFTAAWVVRMAFADNVEFYPGVYGEAPPPEGLVAGRDLILVDFSYKRPVLDGLIRSAASVLVLDHHKTAKSELAGIQPPFGPTWGRHQENVYQDICEGVSGTPYALFDMDRSGAQITWDFFFPGSKRPALVEYTGDRDLWRFEMPESREINAFVFAHEYTFDNWDDLNESLRSPDSWARAVAGGKAIEKKHFKDVRELIEVSRRRMNIGGMDVWVANMPYTMASDAGHLMSQGEAFAATYIDTAATRKFSLRSDGVGGADVSLVAKKYGGGGHKNAAGFEVPREALDAMGLL